MPTEPLSDRLERLLQGKFDTVNVEEIARQAHMSAATLRRVLSGEIQSLKLEDGVLLARLIGVTPEEIAFGEGWLQPLSVMGGSKDYPARVDLTKLAATVHELTKETKRLGGRLKTLEARDRSGRGQRQSGRPRA